MIFFFKFYFVEVAHQKNASFQDKSLPSLDKNGFRLKYDWIKILASIEAIYYGWPQMRPLIQLDIKFTFTNQGLIGGVQYLKVLKRKT